MSEFFEQVYEIVEKIPVGYVVSYIQIARALGKPRGARVVGYAMRNAPKERDLPCHRVVNQKCELAPAHVFGDVKWQKLILESEGISFQENGQIDMKKHQWPEI